MTLGAIGCLAATDPLDLPSVLPLALLLHSVLTDISADSMLFACFPFADVLAAVCPDESTVALSLIIDELTRVHLAIFPLELAITVHFILAPVTYV